MTVSATALAAVIVAAMLASPLPQREGPPEPTGPEDFDVKVTMTAPRPAVGSVIVPLIVHVDRYTPPYARTALTDALKHGGYPGFLRALREAPRAGYVALEERRIVVRWARQVADDSGRTLSFVTDAPIYFAGATRRGAKPTAGYEVAVLQLRLDHNGRGEGTLAAAARVKPLDVTGVQIDGYAETPFKVTAVTRLP